MRRSVSILWIGLAVAGMTPTMYGYVEPAHKAMTLRVFDRLAIDFNARLGVSRGYLAQDAPLRTWMAQGAYDEDDWPRPRNHFFDPIHYEGLQSNTPGCFDLGQRADHWVLQESGETGNEFSLAQAKTEYAEALLGPNPGTRDVFLKGMFETLGHVVHLIQDMAQPEHTRNDQHHPDLGGSLYEIWGAKNLVDIVPGEEELPLYDYKSTPVYPTVRLPDYYDYFHTLDMVDGRPAGKGIADYSNLNFVTQDTNYHDEDPFWSCPGTYPSTKNCAYYTEPKLEEADSNEIVSWYKLLDNAQPEVVIEELYRSFPNDRYRNVKGSDIFHTYLSSIDHETGKHGCAQLYSLSGASYMSRANLLIPRALAYSAGLVEHMFRGSIDATWTILPNFSDQYTLKITNLSKEAIGADAHLRAAYMKAGGEDADDVHYVIDDYLEDLIEGFPGIPPGGSVTIYNVEVPGLEGDEQIKDLQRRILVEGTLGAEQDAVIGLVQEKVGLRAKLETSQDLVRMRVLCSGPTGSRQIPNDYQLLPPQHDIEVEFKGGESCRVVLSSVEIAVPGSEGTAVTLNLKVWKYGELREDLDAEIDASDTAVAGNHGASDFLGSRFINRVSNCAYTTYPKYTCQNKSEPWN